MRVFVSYRRRWSVDDTARITDRLRRNQAFEVLLGSSDLSVVEVPAALMQAIRTSDVLLVIIDPDWARFGSLADTDEWVGRELREALGAEVRIVPVLVNGAKLPRREQLPGGFDYFAQATAFEIDTATRRFSRDMDDVEEMLLKLGPRRLPTGPASPQPPVNAPPDKPLPAPAPTRAPTAPTPLTRPEGARLKLFLSYRRAQSLDITARIEERLRLNPAFDVFVDGTGLRIGGNFPAALVRELRTSDVLLVVIGRGWADSGPRRSWWSTKRTHDVRNHDDWVRRELLEAREAGVEIVPLLVNDARMPAASELPRALAFLADAQAYEISSSHRRFPADMAGLEEELAELSRRSRVRRLPLAAPNRVRPPQPRFQLTLAVGGAVFSVAIAWAAVLAFRPVDPLVRLDGGLATTSVLDATTPPVDGGSHDGIVVCGTRRPTFCSKWDAVECVCFRCEASIGWRGTPKQSDPIGELSCPKMAAGNMILSISPKVVNTQPMPIPPTNWVQQSFQGYLNDKLLISIDEHRTPAGEAIPADAEKVFMGGDVNVRVHFEWCITDGPCKATGTLNMSVDVAPPNF